MAKLRTTERIYWGGHNPFIPNYIESEIIEVSRSETQIDFSVKDIVIGENEYFGANNESLIAEYTLQVIREKRFSVSVELFNQLYMVVESIIDPELTPFEKDILRPKVAFLYYFQNDKIVDENDNQFCLYGTQPNQWAIC